MIKEIKGDITKIEADVIVNSANTELVHGGGVALAIAKAGGEKVIQESSKIEFVPLGEFAITSAGNLKAKEIIHIPTIDYKNNKTINYSTLKKVLIKTFNYCQEKNYKKIATPLLATGVVGLSKQKVKDLIKTTAQDFKDLQVIIVEK